MISERTNAYLVLEDKSVFSGYFFGAQRPSQGEVVFNTGMVGYPETLTDPSYCGQILTMTYPLIGNYGVPDNARKDGLLTNFESEEIQIRGLVVSDYSARFSHWSAVRSLGNWMQQQNIPGIYCIDTRKLTQVLRERGTMKGRIVMHPDDILPYDTDTFHPVRQVSRDIPMQYGSGKKKVLLVDCGVKNNIIRALVHRDVSLKCVPWDYDFTREQYDGVVLSNGPGDPRQCTATIAHTQKALNISKPILGICLGSQILALAAGAETYKLKYGHRGHNQPCLESGTKRCYITSQNHGYAVDAATLPQDWREWFVNLNDGTNEGIVHISKPFFGAQFHPEASPGPDDSEVIFDMFVRAL